MPCTAGKQTQFKANQSQYKPNSRKAKMKLNFYSTKDYENEPRLPALGKQTQSNPIPQPPFLPQKSTLAPKNNLKKPYFALNHDNFSPNFVNHKPAIPA